MTVETRWWNLREPSLGLPFWILPAAPLPIFAFVSWAMIYGQVSVGLGLAGIFGVGWGLVLLRVFLGNRGASLRGATSAIEVGFKCYLIAVVLIGTILSFGLLLKMIHPSPQTRFLFDLIRDWNAESILIVTAMVAALAGIRWGDARWRLPIGVLLALDGFGFYCLYLGGTRGAALPISLEGVFWILQLPLLLTLFSSMISIESRKYWDTVRASQAAPYRSAPSR